ncbi:hypothetical protein ACE0DR_28855 [Azotobacter sp. CWF10]
MSDSSTTTRIVLASRPQGAPTAANFRLEHAAPPPLGDGEVLLRNRYLHWIRACGRMDEGPSHAAPVAVGAVMEGQTVAEVLQSVLRVSQWANWCWRRAVADPRGAAGQGAGPPPGSRPGRR